MSNKGKIRKINTVCPRCGGTGFARVYNRNTKYGELGEKAKKLYESGLTLREVGKEIGIKYPQSVNENKNDTWISLHITIRPEEKSDK